MFKSYAYYNVKINFIRRKINKCVTNSVGNYVFELSAGNSPLDTGTI